MNQHIRFCKAADGVKLAYALSGEGVPLVMSANWLTHLEHQWHSPGWQPWLEAFSRDYRFLRYDGRGCGLSDWHADDLSFEAWVRDLECVVEAASFPRFDLLAKAGAGRLRLNTRPAIPSGSVISFFTAPTRLDDCAGTINQTRSKRHGCCSISPASAGGGRTTPSCKPGPRYTSRAAPSI